MKKSRKKTHSLSHNNITILSNIHVFITRIRKLGKQIRVEKNRNLINQTDYNMHSASTLFMA